MAFGLRSDHQRKIGDCGVRVEITPYFAGLSSTATLFREHSFSKSSELFLEIVNGGFAAGVFLCSFAHCCLVEIDF